jgi:hypothetical protein
LRHVCDNICDMFATGLVCGSVEWGKDRKRGRHGDRVIGKFGVRNAECGLWNIKSKTRNKELGDEECQMRNAEFGVRNVKIKIRN